MKSGVCSFAQWINAKTALVSLPVLFRSCSSSPDVSVLTYVQPFCLVFRMLRWLSLPAASSYMFFLASNVELVNVPAALLEKFSALSHVSCFTIVLMCSTAE